MAIDKAIGILAAGMRAQATRLRVVTENLANSSSTAATPGGLPYQRKVVTFSNVLDAELGTKVVSVSKIRTDTGDFPRRYDPGHPSADQAGYVLLPNVNSTIESADLREAQRSYQANLSAFETSEGMEANTRRLLE